MNTRNLSITEIELDFTNPRIARMLEMYASDEISAEQVALALGAAGGENEGDTYTTFRSLKESIRTHRGVIHPIIVNHTNEDRYVVIEGNTRVLIYRDFIDVGMDGEWSTIPAIIHENLAQGDVDAIRLQAHLVGPRPWEAYSKARYLNQLYNNRHLTLDQIVENCGGRRKEVQNYIDAFNDMENHYRPMLREGEIFDAQKFSAFVELQRSNVQRALVYKGFSKDDFARWVISELLYPLNTVRQLPRILNNHRLPGSNNVGFKAIDSSQPLTK